MVLFKFDLSQPGLRGTLREYEELVLMYVWEVGGVEANSRDVGRRVNERLGDG